MDKQAVLDVLNSLEVIESNGGDDAYILVANDEETRAKLNAVGVSSETIQRYGDDETFCILALAFGEGYADEYRDGKLVLWGPIDDELRSRVSNGEGTPSDAERLLKELDCFSSLRDPVRWFAWEMEKTLRQNKGGWESYSLGYLITRLAKEVRELEEQVARAQFTAEDRERTVRESTDVANIAMMIADKVQHEKGNQLVACRFNENEYCPECSPEE